MINEKNPSSAYPAGSRTSLAAQGWRRVTSGEDAVSAEDAPHGVFTAVRAINGDAVLGPACEVHAGDPPQEGDRIAAGEVRLYPLTQIDVAEGVVEVARG